MVLFCVGVVFGVIIGLFIAIIIMMNGGHS